MASAKYNLIKEFPRDDTSESLLEDDSHSEANYMLKKERTAKRTRYWNLVKHTLFAVSLFLNGVMWWSTFRHMHIKDPFLQTYSKHIGRILIFILVKIQNLGLISVSGGPRIVEIDMSNS